MLSCVGEVGGWWERDENTPILRSLLYRQRHRWPPRVKSMLDYHCERLCPLLSFVGGNSLRSHSPGDAGVLVLVVVMVGGWW